MKMNVFAHPQRHNNSKRTLFLRLALAAGVVLGAMAVALGVLYQHKDTAKAANNIQFSSTVDQPWGTYLDGSNHLWVAEPNCDASPVCTAPPGPGTIGEYDAATLNKIQDFTTTLVYNPVFLALDASGNVWFTDPSHGAIGELNATTKAMTETAIPNTTPYDLVFDNNGKIWFTDFTNGAVGLFDPTSNTYLGETKTPTSSVVYGITKDPAGTIWVAENNQSFIASFTPAASGSGLTITEHAVMTNSQHLITSDNSGKIWFSTGFNGQIGSFDPSTNTAATYCISNSVTSPHISGIGVDNTTGHIWFTDSINARLGFLDPKTYSNDCASTTSLAGVTYTQFSSSAHPHDGLLVDSAGNVFFTEQFAYQVGKAPAGAILPPPTTTLPPGPVAKNWYFAEGRVGGGFREFITVGNPDPANSCIVDVTYLLENGTPQHEQLTIAPGSRKTREVGTFFNRTPSSPGLSFSTLLANDPASPCLGFVAERPMYFNWHGDTSGTDVVGATHTNTNFFFADVPNGSGFTSFITILNPPGGQNANVTVAYYANGNQVGTQTLAVATGIRGTIYPSSANLPAHSSAVITSTAPVVVERPTYYINSNGGFAGMVSGAASVVGSQNVQKEWFLAEGYAGQNSSGGKTQENLVVANVDPTVSTAATVTINLEYLDGTKKPFTVTVPHNSQLIWDVNQNSAGGPSNEVSADVVSTGAGIVVSRQMYFTYAHTINGSVLRATGGTEVTGQVGTYTSYSFAEGYNNTGYNEWLTLQNPTANAETINITLVNGQGLLKTVQVPLGPSTRANFDVTAYVRANMGQAGNTSSFEISMTVQTTDGSLFVAERPMYFNTTGSQFPTQGGTDAFGYTGN